MWKYSCFHFVYMLCRNLINKAPLFVKREGK